MRSLLRWTAKFGVISSAILGTWLATSLPTWAIPRADLLNMLKTVPMFVLTDLNGAPVVQNLGNQQSLVQVFLSPSAAETLLTQLRAQSPEVGRQAQVSPITLEQTYLIAEANAQQGLRLRYIPTSTQREYAQRVWQRQRRSDQPAQFPGTPLFVARVGPSYLSVQQQGSETVVPFFFDPLRLEQVVQEFLQANPDAQGSISVQVVPLEGVIRTLETQDDADLDRIELVPLREALDYITENSGS
ncbi:MAG: Tic22 family protein [Cyanobacteria bacterium P01_G01_bin.54]